MLIEEYIMKDLIEPIELIEPNDFLSEITSGSNIVIKCNSPGYICHVGKDIEFT